MQIKISVRHGHLSEEAQEVIRQKAEKLLHFFTRLTIIEITVDLQDTLNKSVELLVSAEHKHDFVARESAEELQAAVDLAIHKLERQLTKYKEKIQDHHRRDAPKGGLAATEAREESPS